MKKLICAVLTAILTLSTAVFAAPDGEQLNDLKKYKIMVGDEDGDMRLDDTITRAEAAKMICALQRISTDNFADSVELSAFPDVADSHWAKGYINKVKEVGIVNGDEKGNFNPEAEITNEEIIKMLVNVLGYGPMAEQTGGFPMGYTRTAQRIGLTGELQLDVEAAAVRGDVAVMFAQALDIPLMAQTGWSADGSNSYMILDGSAGTEYTTLRTKYFSTEQIAVLRVEKVESE